MKPIDLKTRFISQYKGDIKDPVLTTLIETLDAYQQDVQNQLLLTTYAQRSDQISDGLFEVLRRHLFGQMFPGPSYVVLQATLRDVKTAKPVLLQQSHYFHIHGKEGQYQFAPQYPTWIVPALSNDVRVEVFGNDIMLGFNLVHDKMRNLEEGIVSIYTGDVDPLIVERIRCRISQAIGFRFTERKIGTIIRQAYPGKYTGIDEFFSTPFQNRFLEIPFEVFSHAVRRTGKDDLLWLPLQGLGPYGQDLEKKLILNAFTAWNMVAGESLAIKADDTRYKVSITDHKSKVTIIIEANDLGYETPVEYIDSASVIDSGYPFQYTAVANNSRDEVVLSCTPPPNGSLKVRYCQYDIGDSCIGIAPGLSYTYFKGVDETLKSVQSLTPTQRIDVLNNKERIWDYFRSLLANRLRWLTKDDLRIAIGNYPPFASREKIVRTEKISFEEKVGRVKGFLTPFTEIVVPVREKSLLNEPDRSYFEKQIGLYLKNRTVNGNFVRVKLVKDEN